MRVVILLVILSLSLPALAIKVPMCSIICENGQACGDRCISKKEVCEIPLDWGSACDANYIKVLQANKAKCCQGKGGVAGCAGDRIVCNNGTMSDKCGCLFIVEGENAN